MKLKTLTKILIAACFIGLSLLLYPSFSNLWNEKHATRAINTYVEDLHDLSEEKYRKMWFDAVAYNELLVQRNVGFYLPSDLRTLYYDTLNVTTSGVMGYVEIPSIAVSLPLFHGTSDAVLQAAIGHLEWSSLPVGGENTHCVVSAHRGLPSAKLFTDLNRVREGDIFTVSVLDEILTYEVDQIRTVLPTELSDLVIEQGKDYFTLVTCTPYGINTHRLLVRGHRIPTTRAGANVISEAVMVDWEIVSFYLALPFLIILVLIVLFKKPEKQKPELEDD